MFNSPIISFIVSLVISACIGALFYPNWLWVTVITIVTYCIQLLISQIINHTLWLNKQKELNMAINERVNKIYSQMVRIKCVNGDCNHEFMVPVWFHKENIQECPVCHTQNKIIPNIVVSKSEHDVFRI